MPCRLRLRTAGTSLEVDRLIAGIGEFDEVVGHGRPGVSAASVDLVDDDPGIRGHCRKRWFTCSEQSNRHK